MNSSMGSSSAMPCHQPGERRWKEHSRGGVGELEPSAISGTSRSSSAGVAISAGGSNSTGRVFLPFPRPRVDDVFFLGGILVA